jgi:hypothetical protein
MFGPTADFSHKAMRVVFTLAGMCQSKFEADRLRWKRLSRTGSRRDLAPCADALSSWEVARVRWA